ncbi:hypothetical protein Tco_1511051, partial [Tanacetum coccineum]
MTSFDYRLHAIKKCWTCGTLYTKYCSCSNGNLGDKILVPAPDSSQQRIKIERICFDCGDLIRGPNCQRCALIQKKFEEVFQVFRDTSESSDDNGNVVNAPREPFVVKNNPGVKTSQSPPHIGDHCCYKCGDSLDDIFCRRCTCELCGKGAHIGYNCPPKTKTPIISNPELPKNQKVDEPPQALQSLQQQIILGTCQKCGCNEYDGVCFYCKSRNETPISFSTPYSSNDSQNLSNHHEPIFCDFCGNDARYGHYCTPQNYDEFPQISPNFPQQQPCCEDYGGPHETYQCQPMNEDYYHEQNPCYDSNSFGFDQFQPPQYTVGQQILISRNETFNKLINSQNELLKSRNELLNTQITTLHDLIVQAIQIKEEEKRIADEQAAKERYWKIPICDDDD